MENRDPQGVAQRLAQRRLAPLGEDDGDRSQGDVEHDEGQDRHVQPGVAEGEIGQGQSVIADVHHRRGQGQCTVGVGVEAQQAGQAAGQHQHPRGIKQHEQEQGAGQFQPQFLVHEGGKDQRRGKQVKGAVGEGLEVGVQGLLQREAGEDDQKYGEEDLDEEHGLTPGWG